MKNKIKNYYLENKIFCYIFLLSIILHIIAFISLGFNYNIGSDDVRYLESGIRLYNEGILSLYGTKTVQIMPGLSIFIAFIYDIFKNKLATMIAIKIIYSIFSLISLSYLYKIIKKFSTPSIAALVCLFFLTLDYIWLDNLILTETPFIMCFILLIYHSLKLVESKKIINYIGIIIFYLLALYIRPIIAPYPIFYLIYLMLKHINIKNIIKGFSVGIIIVCLALLPWVIRNYKVYNKFIPLTVGSGNPMFWGTYQGYGYPSDEELDYSEVYKKMDKDLYEYTINNQVRDENLINYYSQEKDSMMAKYRMRKWWEKDKIGFLFSYLIYKPGIMLFSSFYWGKIVGIPKIVNIIIHLIEFLIFLVSLFFILKKKSYLKESIFIFLVYIYMLYSTAIGLAFSRYALTTYFLRIIIIGIGINIIKSILKEKIK